MPISAVRTIVALINCLIFLSLKDFFTYSKQNQSRHFHEEMQFIASKSRFIARLEFHKFLSNRICDYLGLKNIRTAFF